MAKTLSAFQRWRLSRSVKKQFEKEKKDLYAKYSFDYGKYRADYAKTEQDRLRREQGFGKSMDKTYDPKSYEDYVKRHMRIDYKPLDEYFRSVKEHFDKMLESAQAMALAEAAQAKGYTPWARDAQAYAAAREQYAASKAALSEVKMPEESVHHGWSLSKDVKAVVQRFQTYMRDHDIGQRTEVNVEAALAGKCKAEQKWEKKQEAKTSARIDKQLRENAKNSKERNARQQEQIKGIPEEVRAKYGLDEPERKSVGDKLKDKLHAAKVDRQISKQLKDKDKTRAEREARQEKEALATMDEKQRAKYGFASRERSDDLTKE